MGIRYSRREGERVEERRRKSEVEMLKLDRPRGGKVPVGRMWPEMPRCVGDCRCSLLYIVIHTLLLFNNMYMLDYHEC